MTRKKEIRQWIPGALVALACIVASVPRSSAADDEFAALVRRLQSEKPAFAKRQQDLLAGRYDLADRPAAGVTMARGKPVQAGVRVKLPKGVTWDQLAAMAPEGIASSTRR